MEHSDWFVNHYQVILVLQDKHIANLCHMYIQQSPSNKDPPSAKKFCPYQRGVLW